MKSTCSRCFEHFWKRIGHQKLCTWLEDGYSHLLSCIYHELSLLWHNFCNGAAAFSDCLMRNGTKLAAFLGQSNMCDDSMWKLVREERALIKLHIIYYSYVYLTASRDCRPLGWGLHTETWLSLSQHGAAYLTKLNLLTPQQETPESDTMSLEVDIPFLLERLQVLQTDHKQTPQFHQYPTESQDFWTGRWGLDFTCYGNADHRHGRVCWSCVGLVALVKASAPFPFIYWFTVNVWFLEVSGILVLFLLLS